MSANTKIEWCDHSWSPWRGCTKVSPGCANCYAENLSHRNPGVFGQWGKGKPRVLAKNWGDPARWNKDPFIADYEWAPGLPQSLKPTHRRSVFPSLCDWLDPEVPIEWLLQFLRLIHDTPNLTWLLLTKRPELWTERIISAASSITDVSGQDELVCEWLINWIYGNAPANVWVGTSVEDQKRADERIPKQIKIPAKWRFLSVEPLITSIDLHYSFFNGADSFGSMPGIDWVIVGGESGSGARPCNVEWIRDVVRQCAAAGVPCFVKQLGSNVVQSWNDPSISPSTFSVKLKHPKGGDPAEWPEDLRVRQFPEVVR